jgi:hypothetical protein
VHWFAQFHLFNLVAVLTLDLNLVDFGIDIGYTRYLTCLSCHQRLLVSEQRLAALESLVSSGTGRKLP